MILDGRALHGKSLAEYLAWGKFLAVGIRRGWTAPAPTPVADADPLSAWIQQGVLVVTCPDCKDLPDNELQPVWLEGPHVMFCTVCGNAGVGGLVRPVALPADFESIVRLLSVRPLAARTWRPGESLDDLRAENVAHGLPIDDEVPT